MRVEILGSGHRDIVNGSRFYDEQQRGLGNYFASYVYSELEGDVVKVWRILDNRRDPHWVDAQL